MANEIHLRVVFFKTSLGKEPVRDWLKSLSWEEKKVIGEDIKTVQFGWPLGMPVVRKLAPRLWEVRTTVKDGIARVIFTVDDGLMVLLHGFIKKTQKTPQNDLHLARERLFQLRGDR